MERREIYEFGPFMLDVADRRLVNDGELVQLPPKAHDVLVALIRRAGHLVSKQQLLDLVWPDTHVEEGILSVHVANLRKTLGDQDSAQRYIETVPRAGYRFAATITQRPANEESFPLRWPIGVLPANPAVSELIGRGRSHLLTSSRNEIPKAVAAFRAAIDLDSTYAAAHAGLALACCAQAELRLVPHADAFDEARAAALRALAMDSSSADAQVALGAVLFLSDWNWAGAQRSLERAITLDPNHADAYLLYGRLLDALGQLGEGLAAKQKALEQNPDSARMYTQMALSYWNQRHYDDVIEWATRALDRDPRHLLAREFIAGAYLMKGDLDRHMVENLAHAEAAGVPVALLDELRQLYAREGRRGVVIYAIGHVAAQGGPPLQLAVLHGELGEKDEAFRHLDRAIEGRDPCLVDLAVAPQWDPLRDDIRFSERLTRIGLSPRRTITTEP